MSVMKVFTILGYLVAGALGLKCEFYSRQKCVKEWKEQNRTLDTFAGDPADLLGFGSQSPECWMASKTCSPESEQCFATWTPLDGSESKDVPDSRRSDFPEHRSGHLVQLMGCMDGSHKCNDTLCHATRKQSAAMVYFCCCKGDLCNQNFTHSDEPVVEPPANVTEPTPPTEEPVPGNSTFMYAVIPAVIVLAAVSAALYYVYVQRKAAARASGRFGPVSAVANDEEVGVDDEHKPIRLLEIKARGRFGAVWRGELKYPDQPAKIVAVKIFPLQDKASWQAEQDIYNLPRMEHENILKFLGVERRGENLQMEFWLTSEFHERGSLCDFLKSNVVTWDDLCRIGISMARGLTHLHEEIAQSTTNSGTVLDMKPAIAHRDFKSKNVLIKSDMTACIADFGLALIFEPGKSCGDTHGQVGTRRYMAPEVLEGAINFSRDAFLRIDMYACGLVLWELASRCTAVLGVNNHVVSHPPPPEPLQNNSQPPHYNNLSTNPAPSRDLEYKLPFEAEISNPSLEQMRDLVVNQKVRPLIKDAWKGHSGMAALCDTIEECWDQDAEARLSASCVMERIRSFQRMAPAATSQPPPTNDEYMNAVNASAALNHLSDEAGDGGEATPLIIMNNHQQPIISPRSTENS